LELACIWEEKRWKGLPLPLYKWYLKKKHNYLTNHYCCLMLTSSNLIIKNIHFCYYHDRLNLL
jgi:hypothetical protein